MVLKKLFQKNCSNNCIPKTKNCSENVPKNENYSGIIVLIYIG